MKKPTPSRDQFGSKPPKNWRYCCWLNIVVFFDWAQSNSNKLPPTKHLLSAKTLVPSLLSSPKRQKNRRLQADRNA